MFNYGFNGGYKMKRSLLIITSTFILLGCQNSNQISVPEKEPEALAVQTFGPIEKVDILVTSGEQEMPTQLFYVSWDERNDRYFRAEATVSWESNITEGDERSEQNVRMCSKIVPMFHTLDTICGHPVGNYKEISRKEFLERSQLVRR